ncbi:RNA 3 -terminal phosphate cyclase [Phlyctema vagabunda]|uniref:RNA 3 -terminal phosphate cyclase n=1 Tax=Phlyctema vagabunda TaxID=108571 RepID=A0ABR4P6N9_9HELO
MAMIRLDGRVGEGGGQVVRVAIGLSALTGVPVRIDNIVDKLFLLLAKYILGLKAQHVASIKWLAEATEAKVSGLIVGSRTIEFTPQLSPAEIKLDRTKIRIRSDTAASVLLVFQAILPFLLFAGDHVSSAIDLRIQGGTNVGWSLSYEYLDQVLLPSLERFGVIVKRKLQSRGWSLGRQSIGEVHFQITPLGLGCTLRSPDWPLERGFLSRIDVTIVVPAELIKDLKASLQFELDLVFPGVEAKFVLTEDSGDRARLYTLLVAHTTTGLRFGRDWLYDRSTKLKTVEFLSKEVSQKVVDDLDKEYRKGGVVDEFLQDQLVVFQALATGESSIPPTSRAFGSSSNRVDKTDEPFGDGSLHTTTARWVTSQLLPSTKWIDKGR